MAENTDVVQHRGRRYKRPSARSREQNKRRDSLSLWNDDSHGEFPVLPPPTPPTGKTRTHMNTSHPFQYQRFKPLPSIGSDFGPGHHMTDADSAVDLTSPLHVHSSVVDSTRIRTGSDPLLWSSYDDEVEGDGGRKSNIPQQSQNAATPLKDNHHSIAKALSTATNIPPNSSGRDVADMDLLMQTVQTNSFEHSLPPEPLPTDAHSVTLCVRLPDGSRLQRRFNHHIDTLQTVVNFALVNRRKPEIRISDSFVLCDNSVPRVVFTDLSLRLEEVALVHNTMLHLTAL